MYIKIDYFLLNENVQQAKTILKKLNLNPSTEKDFKDISKKLSKIPNLIGKFIDFRYNQSNSMEDINRVIDWIINNRDLVNKLPKNILQYEKLEELGDDIKIIEKKHKANQFYKSLYKSMRDQVDKLSNDKRIEFDHLSEEFMNLPDEKKKLFTPLKYFEYNNIGIEDFIKYLHNFLAKNIINEDEKIVLEKIQKYGDAITIRYNMNNVIVIETSNFEAVKELGSSSWCIVYGSDSYRESYFGPTTYNTQLIVFNFNLPSISPDSIYGITIRVDGKPMGSGCQDKNNHNVSIEHIISLTNLPEYVFKPNEQLVAKYKIRSLIDNISVEFSRIIRNTTKSIIDIIEEMKEKLNTNIADDLKKEIDIDSTIYDILRNLILDSEGITNSFLIKNFDKKEIEEVKSILNNGIVKHLLLDISIRSILLYSLRFSKSENSKFIFIYRLSFEKNMSDMVITDTIIVNSAFHILKLINDTNTDDIISLIKTDNKKEIKSYVDDIYNRIRKVCIEYTINNPATCETFEQYKNIYDQNVEEDEPYEKFVYDELYLSSSYKFIDEESYRNFLLSLINDYETEKILDNICEESRDSYTYDILDKYDKELTSLYVNSGTMPNEKNNILGLMMYKNTDTYKEKFKKDIDIKTDENGVDYVIVSDFTSFDDLIFDEEYFNQMDDIYDDFYDYDISEYSDDLDYYNVIYISKFILDNFPELPNLSKSIIDKYVSDNKINMILINEYKGNSEIDELYKNLKDLLFETDEDELDEIDETLFTFLQDDVLKDIFREAIRNSQRSAFEDNLFNKLVDEIGDVLGGGYWKDDKYKRIFKTVKNEKDDYELRFTIDISEILKSIKDYSGLYYQCGDDFKWDDIIKYYAHEMTSPFSVDFDRISDYADKDLFNETIRNL